MTPKNNNYPMYVLNDVATVKEQLDTNPVKYRTSSELLNAVTSANRKSVEKAFKEIYGIGIKTYHVKQRLIKSKKYLEEGMTVKLAASACLYKSQNAYGAAFKKEFAMTPTEWLKIVSKETTKKLSRRKGQ